MQPNSNEDKYSKKINMQDLALILRAANEDFEGASRMKRDEVGSQDSSFRNSLDSAGYITPKPSIMPAMDARETYNNKPMSNSVYYENIHNLSTGSAFLMDRAESEAGAPGHKKSSTMHIGPHLGKDRGDIDPKLKALGSEISKRISEIRRHDETGPDVVAMENESLAYDETLQQKTTCQHCLMIRRRVIVPKHKDGGNIDFLYCDKHVPAGGKGLSKAKTPNIATAGRSPFKGNKPETNIERSKTPPKKVVLEPKADNTGKDKGFEELKKLLEMTEKDLYEANEELKKMGFENRTLQEELEKVENAKDEYARQLMIANTAYKESVKIIESLLEQIKRHLGNDLKFYDKVYNKAVEGSDKAKWMEVVKEISPLKAECEDILRKIRERAWETVAVRESEEFLQQLDEARKLRRIVLELKMEDNMNKEINKKLERYIKDLEEQMDNLKNDPKNANKNNIMKVLQLTKELKESGIREAELNKELEGLKANLFDLKEEYDALKANNHRSSKPKFVANEDVEEAIRQLALIILSKDAEGISEQTRAVLKDVFPATMQKSILQWEQRVRELEEQNKRLLDDYTAEVQRGAYVTSTAIELCLRLVELLSIFESNKSANLPPGLKKFREDLFEDRPKLEQIYEELEEGLRGYEKKLQKRGRESLALDVNRMGPQSGILTSNAPMFGYTKDKGKANEGDESELAAALRKAMEENEDIQRRLETVQMENSSLGIQLNQARNKEEGLQRALGELKGKYDAVTRGKSPRRETENVNTSKVLKMGGRSVEDSFSVLNDLGTDMNWFRAKVNENVDYLMMIHVQAMALEDRIARGQELEVIGRQFETSLSRKGDRGDGNYQKRGFSFTE